MVSADLLREARLRAGLTQRELARRARRPQSSIARWESGKVRPSLETLRDVIRACDLELTYRLANYDDSYVEWIDGALALSPSERLDASVHVTNTIRELEPAFEARDR
jgi:transcriptional regulator with XRE-family HTH domain